MTATRRVAAILAADVVGYSRRCSTACARRDCRRDEGAEAGQVRCSSLVDWPVCRCLGRTMGVSTPMGKWLTT
jgi:hypothetical protein